MTVTVISGIFNIQLQFGGKSGLACPFTDLTTLQSMQLFFAVPGLVIAMLAVGYIIEVRHRHKRQVAGKLTMRLSETSSRRYEGALLKAVTLAWSTMLFTTFELLDCIDLGALGGSMLFRAADETCGGWERVIWSLLSLVLVLPVIMALIAAAGVCKSFTKRVSLSEAMVRKLSAPYREGCGHWEAVLALHRFAVVVIYSFVQQLRVFSAVLQTLICSIALAVHVQYQPFKDRSANHTQAALLALLVCIAQLNVPSAMLQDNAGKESDRAQNIVRSLEDAEVVLLVAPALVMGSALFALAWRRRLDMMQGAAYYCSWLGSCPAGWAFSTSRNAQGQLGSPLLSRDEAASPAARVPKIVQNSRGLRLTYATPESEARHVRRPYGTPDASACLPDPTEEEFSLTKEELEPATARKK